jgi:FkbM family methyltransferase
MLQRLCGARMTASPVKPLVNRLLQRGGLALSRHRTFARLIEGEQRLRKLDLLLAFEDDGVLPLARHLRQSKSELGQDLFALAATGLKRGGTFVEFGAGDGILSSNTWLLETAFGWKGILAEPAAVWHAPLFKNRTAQIEPSCVWRTSGELLPFEQATRPELSTLAGFRDHDGHGARRRVARSYGVKTISLLDLLAKYDAPREIDYLSLDTEGSELAILEAFDFDRYAFRVITCEHNFSPAREKVHTLLRARGYVRKFEAHSRFDDFYVRSG